MNLSRISIERPTLLAVLFSVLLVFGAISYAFLSYELVPKFTPPVITVVSIYPGATPEEVETDVSMVIEDAFSSLQNVETIQSTSKESFSLVRLELQAGTDTDLILQEANRKLLAVLGDLPPEVGNPTLTRFDFDDLPIMRLGLRSDLDEVSFSRFIDDRIIPEINKISGVAQVRLLGAVSEEVTVNVDPQRLNALGVSLLQVVGAINSANISIPSGTIESLSNRQGVRFSSRFYSLAEIEDINIFDNPMLGRSVKLNEVATVTLSRSAQDIITRIEGAPSLGLEIKKQGNANAVDIAASVAAAVADMQADHSEIGLQIDIAQDTSEFTLAAANAVRDDLFMAISLVTLVMLIFLHSVRSSFIVFVSIPTSIIATFTVMYLLGYTLNLLTLLGLSLAIGILVDDSIVVLENIYRHLEMGKNRVKAAYDGRMEIGYTAISITLIDVVVFLPIIFSEGMVADLLRQFSVVIVTSTLLSLLVSFTIVPYLASRIGKAETQDGHNWLSRLSTRIDQSLEGWIDRIEGLLRWSFGHQRIVLGTALLLLIVSSLLIAFGFIGIEFTKAGDRGELLFELELPQNTPLHKTNSTAFEVESYLKSLPFVTSVFTTVGTTSSGRISSNASYLAEFNVKLTPKEDRDFSTAQASRMIKFNLEGSIPGIKLKPVEINIIGLRDDDAVQVTLLSNDEALLQEKYEEAFRILKETPATVEETSSAGEGTTEIDIQIDRAKADALGINHAMAGMTVRTAVNGNSDSKFLTEEIDLPINVQIASWDKQNINDLRAISVLNNRGAAIPISEFTRMEETQAPATLERTNRTRSITLKSQIIGKPAGSVSRDYASRLYLEEQPDGIEYLFGGQSKRTTDGLKTMGIAFAISILLVYLVLVGLYDSYFYPFVILFSIPLAVIGAFLALALAQQSLSIFSILGLVMLVGLVGKNAILVVDFANALRKQGHAIQEALLQATRMRFRPILMTNLTMVFGLLPIALAQGAGSEWKNGLAWALIGGLVSSMLLTLVVVPVVYNASESLLGRLGVNLNKPKVRIDSN